MAFTGPDKFINDRWGNAIHTDGLEYVLASKQPKPTSPIVMLQRFSIKNSTQKLTNLGDYGFGDGVFSSDTYADDQPETFKSGQATLRFGDEFISNGVRAKEGVLDLSGLTVYFSPNELVPSATLVNYKIALNPYSVPTTSPIPSSTSTATPSPSPSASPSNGGGGSPSPSPSPSASPSGGSPSPSPSGSSCPSGDTKSRQ